MRRTVAIGSLLVAMWATVAIATGSAEQAQSTIVIPQMAGDGPVGVILGGQYTRFDGRSLLGPPPTAETAPQRLARRYAQLTTSKDKQGLLELYFSGDGSKERIAPLIGQSNTFQPEFNLLSVTLLEQLQWDGLTVLTIALKGDPVLKPEKEPLLAVCPEPQTCYLVSPQIGPQNEQEFKTLGTVLTLFSKFSTPATPEQRQTFLERDPVVVALKPNPTYASPSSAPIKVQLLVESYVNVPPMSTSGGSPPSYEKRPELKALFGLLQRLRTMDKGEITEDNQAFRQFMNQEFHAAYAADLSYGVSRLIDGEYAVDSLTATDFVTTVRSWDSVEPVCAVRHGDTVFVYVRAGHGQEPKSLQLFPVKVANGHADFEAVKFGNYVAGLLQTPELLKELEKSCKAKELK